MIEVDIFRGVPGMLVRTVYAFLGSPSAYVFIDEENTGGVPRLEEVDRIDLRIFPYCIETEDALVIQTATGGRITMSEFNQQRLYAQTSTWLANAPDGKGWTIYGQAPRSGCWMNDTQVEQIELDTRRHSVVVTRAGKAPEFQVFDWLFDYSTGQTLFTPFRWRR